MIGRDFRDKRDFWTVDFLVGCSICTLLLVVVLLCINMIDRSLNAESRYSFKSSL